MTDRDRPIPARGRNLPPEPADGVVYAVGDIHGCYGLLVDLLGRIVADVNRTAGRRDDLLIFLGDYVDRGPASSAVLNALIWIERNAPLRTLFLMGNHERVMLDYLDDPVVHERWLAFGGDATIRSYGVDVPEDPAEIDPAELRDRFADRLPASHVDFLRRLQLFHETDDFIFAHAGIEPGVPMARQVPEDLLWIRQGFLEERPAGRKRVVHGHTWTSNKPAVMAHRIGVDTGAYRTGVLTAARLHGTDVGFISTAEQPEQGSEMPNPNTAAAD